MRTRIVGLFFDHGREKSVDIAQEIKSARYGGVDVRFVVGEDPTDEGEASCVRKDDDFSQMEFAVSIGGDGTFLRTARVVRELGIPLYGINTGRLGFLASGDPDTAISDIWQILTRQYRLLPRAPLKGELVRNGCVVDRLYALNEIVVTKAAVSRPVELAVYAGGESLYSLLADGLIVSTPTGSTAYALSAGGPIIHPDVRCLLIVPICAHSLYPRPVVFDDQTVVEVCLPYDAEEMLLSGDGQLNIGLLPGDVVRLALDTEKCVYVVKLDDSSFYDVLHSKLNWGLGNNGKGGRRPARRSYD